MRESIENLNDSVRLLNGSYMSIDDYNERKETSLDETLASALAQIEEKQYEANLIAKGIPQKKHPKVWFRFWRKECADWRKNLVVIKGVRM